MNGTQLNGLSGTNPLGFFAALGVQVAFNFCSKRDQPSLWWSNDVVPHAIVDEAFTLDCIAECAISEFINWADDIEALLNLDLKKPSNIGYLKLRKDEMRMCLEHLSVGDEAYQRRLSLVSNLVAEGSLDNSGASKPSDLYFTTGKQKFLGSALKILQNVTTDDVFGSLSGDWKYDSGLPSLRWDVSDSRDYALRARDPSNDTKKTNPGPEALAILGLCTFPVFGSSGRTLTTGCSGSWKNGYFSWPLWNRPAKINSVRSLVSHAYGTKGKSEFKNNRENWFPSWGVFRIYGSSIQRSDEGGYGTFSPAEILWGVT